MVYDPYSYVEYCLNKLAIEIGPRPAGSAANHAATDFVVSQFAEAGYEIVRQEYPCPDWQPKECRLVVEGTIVPAHINTHSLACDVSAQLIAVSSMDELKDAELVGKIAVIYGELTQAGGFFPRNFDFYRDEAQDAIIELLEEKRPAAVITVSPYAGPRPALIQDSEFLIPSVTVSRSDGETLLQHVNNNARLLIKSESLPGWGCNIIARRSGHSAGKVLICAHYDSVHGIPGALDNGAGLAAMLLLARRLQEAAPDLSLEFVAFGGEDSWYPGDASFMQGFQAEEYAAAINLDGLGLKGSKTAVAFFNWPEDQITRFMDMAGENFVTEPFYESDHGFFWTRGIPTIAMTTSDYMRNLLGTIVHTEFDLPEVVDPAKVEEAASFTEAIIKSL